MSTPNTRPSRTSTTEVCPFVVTHRTSMPSQNHDEIAVMYFATRTPPTTGRRDTRVAPLPSDRLVTSGREQPLQRAHVTGAGRGDERGQQLPLRSRAHRGAPFARHVLTGPADQLAHRRFGRLKDVGDLPVRVVERFPQHIRGPLVRRELLHQQQGRELQCLPTLGAQVRISARVNRLGQPRPDVGLVSCPRRLKRVDGQPGRRRRQERGRVGHGAAVGLSASAARPPAPGLRPRWRC